jgi:hypothetical protein
LSQLLRNEKNGLISSSSSLLIHKAFPFRFISFHFISFHFIPLLNKRRRMGLSSLAYRQSRSLASRTVVARRHTAPSTAARRLQSTRPEDGPPPNLQSTKPEDGPPPTLQNVALASVLAGFVFCVFSYSMNAVGGQGDAENDPLAQLKEEAQEARQMKANDHNRKLSKEEIDALESGLAGAYDETTKLEVAVAAEIAAIEEEANLKIFGDEKKKKPWWRFGF